MSKSFVLSTIIIIFTLIIISFSKIAAAQFDKNFPPKSNTNTSTTTTNSTDVIFRNGSPVIAPNSPTSSPPQLCNPQGFSDCPSDSVPTLTQIGERNFLNQLLTHGITATVTISPSFTTQTPVDQAGDACKEVLPGTGVYQVTAKVDCALSQNISQQNQSASQQTQSGANPGTCTVASDTSPTIKTDNCSHPNFVAAAVADSAHQYRCACIPQVAPTASPCTDPTRCTVGGGVTCDSGNGFQTAIGCVHPSPVSFVKDFLTFAVGISGGLAFLMMVLGAFQMLTSAGNPDSLSAGRERMTNAIIGLLLVIFAVLLLQIIGLDILNLKFAGFGK